MLTLVRNFDMSDSDSELSENECNDINLKEYDDMIPEEMREIAKDVALNLLPDKSKRLYTAAYNAFKKWRSENKSNSFDEIVFIAYFSHLSSKYAPPSLWATFSMLKSTISAYNDIDISNYKKLIAFLKKKMKGYRSKKSEVFTSDQVNKFLNEAPDNVYLLEKVVLIFGISGALRCDEFTKITVNDVQKLSDDVLLVKINDTKNDVPRSFTITDSLFHPCWKYIKCRPEGCQINRFFIRYQRGQCISQAVGKNKIASIPNNIALFLNLSNPNGYTGHSLRRTSATLLVDAGADMTTLQRHGGWKSSTVAYGYIANSLNNKRRISHQINTGIEIHKRIRTNDVAPVTVRETIGPVTTSGITATSTQKIDEVPISVVALEENVQPDRSSTMPTTTIKNQQKSTLNVLGSIQNQNILISGNSIYDSSTKNILCEVKSEKHMLPVFYDPDIGLYYQGVTDEKPAFIFKHCNVSIDGSGNTLIFNNCSFEDKDIQKENKR